jgi:hypothetical protein
MPDFPTSPQEPATFMADWLQKAFDAMGPPPGSEGLAVQLGVRLDGEGGGEWVFDIADGALTIREGSCDESAFTYVQSVADWKGALWGGHGGAIGQGAARLFQPGHDIPEAVAGQMGGAPPPAALAEMEKLDGMIEMVVTGGEGGDWSVAFRLGKGPVPEEPTCSIAITSEDAAALASGELDPMQAFMGGKMVVTGDMTLMLQMQAVTMQAAQAAANPGGGDAPKE